MSCLNSAHLMADAVVERGVVAAGGRLVADPKRLAGLLLAGSTANVVGSHKALLLHVGHHAAGAADSALGLDAVEDDVGADVEVVLGGSLRASLVSVSLPSPQPPSFPHLRPSISLSPSAYASAERVASLGYTSVIT